MGLLTLWFSSLDRKWRRAIIAGAVILALAILAVAGYMIVVPKKVLVRYGTIVRDPVDGHVWEDNTQTIWVDPKDASNYQVEYIDLLSEENARKLAEQKAREAEEQAQLEQSQGVESLSLFMTDQQIKDIKTTQSNIETMGENIKSGLDVANEVNEMRSTLIQYRDYFASMNVPPELEPIKQQVIAIFNKYIQASTCYLQAIATGDLTYIDQANALIAEANSLLQSLMPK